MNANLETALAAEFHDQADTFDTPVGWSADVLARGHRLRRRRRLSRAAGAVGVVCVLALTMLVGRPLLMSSPELTPAEITPDAGWTVLPDSPLSPRYNAVGAFVGGRFVVVGGSDDPPCPSNASCPFDTEIRHRDGASFDPVSKQWRTIADAPVPVNGWSVAVVHERMYVFVPNPVDWDSTPIFLMYDPAGDSWSTLPSPPEPHMELVATPSAVLAISSSDFPRPTADLVFDEAAAAWRPLPNDPLERAHDRAAVWTEDGLLLAAAEPGTYAGQGVESKTTLATLDPSLRHWSAPKTAPDLNPGAPRAVGDRIAFSFGRGVLILDPATNAWSPPIDLPHGEGFDDYRLVVGGQMVASDQLLDPTTGAWAALPDPPWLGNVSGATVIAGPDSIFVWGGVDRKWEPLKHGYFLRVTG